MSHLNPSSFRPFCQIVGLIVLAAGIGLGCRSVAQPLPTEDASGNYVWHSVPVGGGGYSVGVEVHPQQPGLIYLRTDVAGIMRRRPDEDTWRQLTQNTFTPEHGRISGCAGVALHPTDTEILWAAFGGGTSHRSGGGIWKSVDQGENWTVSLDIYVSPNFHPNRKHGEALRIDPLNPEVLYFASQGDGIWFTRSGGDDRSEWTQVPLDQVPLGTKEFHGSRSIAIDPTRGSIGKGAERRSAHVYASVHGEGVFQSQDGGEIWRQMPTLPNGGEVVAWMTLSRDGDLYVAHNKGLAKWIEGRSPDWQDVTPGGRPTDVQGVSASSQANGRLVANTGGKKDPIWRSEDGGASWEKFPAEKGEIASNGGFGLYAAPCSVTFDPHDDRIVYMNDAFSVWRSRDFWAETVIWDAMHKGHEETICYTMVSPPEGPRLVAGFADIRGYVWKDDITDYGRRLAWQRKSPSTARTGSDFCEADPSVIYLSSRGPRPDGSGGSSGNINKKCVGAVYKSTDGGQSFEVMSRPFAGTRFDKAEAGGAKIAVSATDPDRAVYLQRVGGLRYTTDGGKTWQDSKIDRPADGEGILHYMFAYDFRHVLASDRVNGMKFYLYARGGDKFYRSVDGGASFQEVSEASKDLPLPKENDGSVAENSGTWGLRVVVAPGLEEEVWLSLAASGIWRASGTGEHKTDRFTRVEYFSETGPANVCFGAPAPGSSTPTVYVFGKRAEDGQWGVFASLDLGQNWTRITPANRPGQWVRYMQGDRQVFGTVYLSDASYGISVGSLKK